MYGCGVILWKETSAEGLVVRPILDRCGSCGQTLVFLSCTSVKATVKGAPYVSLVQGQESRAAKTLDKVEQAVKGSVLAAPPRLPLVCPHCGMGYPSRSLSDTWAGGWLWLIAISGGLLVWTVASLLFDATFRWGGWGALLGFLVGIAAFVLFSYSLTAPFIRRPARGASDRAAWTVTEERWAEMVAERFTKGADGPSDRDAALTWLLETDPGRLTGIAAMEYRPPMRLS